MSRLWHLGLLPEKEPLLPTYSFSKLSTAVIVADQDFVKKDKPKESGFLTVAKMNSKVQN